MPTPKPERYDKDWGKNYHIQRKAELEERERRVQEKILELRARGVIE